MQNSRGFTLIEIVIVIGVIAILAGGAIFFINPENRFNVSRDQQRQSEMLRIASALEQYRSDNGEYPGFGSVTSPTYNQINTINNIAINSTNATYLSPIPTGPNNNGVACNGYVYGVTASGRDYTLYIKLENANDEKALSTKPVPMYSPATGSSTDGYKTFRWTSGTCANTVFNYWINSK